MANALILMYLLALLVRPQDWFGPLMGLPTGYVITLTMFVGGLFNYLSNPRKYSLPQNWLLPTYVILVVFSTLSNVNASAATEQAVAYVQRSVAFFSIVWLVNTRERIFFTIKCFMWIVLFLAFQAMLQAQTGLSWGGQTMMPGYTEIRVRWHGDWDGPNVFAILFIIGVAFSLEFMFGAYKLSAKFAAAVFFVMACIAIYLTNSRGAILALMGMISFYFKARFSKKVAIGLVSVAVFGMLVLGPSRMSEMNSKESSAHERSWAWEQGLTLLRENPILGVGRGQFSERIDSGLIAHNNYVQNFSELGLPGFFIFISLLWFCWKSGMLLSRVRRPGSSWEPSLGKMIQGMVVGYAIVTFFVVMELELLYFVFGLAMASYLVAMQECPDLPTLRMTKRDVGVVLTIMAGILLTVWLIAVKGVI